MFVKVFILGPPGSGKSTAARTIHSTILQRHDIKHIVRLNDYDILWEMFQDDLHMHPPHLREFESTEGHKGFNVKPHAYAAFDEALRRASAKIKLWTASKLEQWVVVEFSRDDYTRALAQFEPSLLKDAYFLYIDAQEDLRRTRLKLRVEHPETPDDHFVSDYILNTYYARATNDSNLMDACKTHGLATHQVKVLTNNGSLEDFLAEVGRCVEIILQFAQAFPVHKVFPPTHF